MVRATLRMLLARLPSAAIPRLRLDHRRAEVEFRHGHFDHAFTGFIESVMAFEKLRGHSGVVPDFGIFGETITLDIARFFHA